MLTAFRRSVTRRVLFPSRAVPDALVTRILPGAVNRTIAPSLVAARPVSVSAWMRSPAKSAAAVKKAKKSTATKTKKKPASKKAKKPASAKRAKKTKQAKKTKKTKKVKTRKAKKKLTDEEKEKANLRQLRKMALLKGPQLLPETAWSVFVADNFGAEEQGEFPDKIRGLADKFSRLSVSEKEGIKATAQSNQAVNNETRQKWVASYPPEAIYMANIARRRIARKLDKSRLYLIHDVRLPKRARTPYALFIKSRFPQANRESSSGSVQDAFRSMSEEWRSMSDSEKQPFQSKAAKEAEDSQTLLKVLKGKAKDYQKANNMPASQVPS
ncbi:uncharacterized protein UV8b_02435 [Ustilaginoidea virens]|uniref:HMG box domain-containing protein n=1 Tax=Ustilaginoidea virens TaxID=1159556 RepID=A0A1B5L0P1_USTVR|nr:uncharacterized protein UV8b_02435 [Ustilaginoidea virens]QUC18194.1 hypothetical protein UV8b_02435 [Ustilaginoidea virens]GAO15927.1 hypothetical protein UVI_02039500 [Ustilaginoidea virens]